MTATLSLGRRRGWRSFRLSAALVVPAPIDTVFAFFADAGNLEAITPTWLHFRVLQVAPPAVRYGTVIDYRLRLHGLPLRWRSVISAWDPPHRFVDEQLRGPYRRWHHEHTFGAVSGGTEVRDRVDYELRLGAAVGARLVARDVRAIFAYRQRTLAARFGEG